MNALTSRLPSVSVDNRVDVITWVLVAFAFLGGVGLGWLPRAQTIRYTRTVRLTLQQQYGQPSASVPGAKVNPALGGLTCDVFRAKATVICHK